MDYEGRKFKREELEHELYWEEQDLIIEREVERRRKAEKAQKAAKQILDNSTFGNQKSK
jgi:hypothetical protein